MNSRLLTLLALCWAGSVCAEVPMVESRSDQVPVVPITTVPPADGVPATTGSRFSQLELLDQMEMLQQEVQNLRGQVEQYQRAVSQLREESRTRYLDLEQRISRVQETASQAQAAPRIDAQALLQNPELLNDPKVLQALDQMGGGNLPPAGQQGPAEAPASQPSAQRSVEPPPAAPASAADLYDGVVAEALDDDELKAYEQARAPISQRNFPQAVVNLRAFLQQFPAGERTGHAWYWLGEVYAAIPDLPAARKAFEQFLKDYPEHPKARDAAYKLAVVHHQLGDGDAARKLLQQVVREHPGTSAAILATNYLRAMVQ